MTWNNSTTLMILRCILALLGIAIIMLGINVGFGGIRTLGWQSPTDFLSITNPEIFHIQDNHIRFLGGFWLAAGLVFVFGSMAPKKMKTTLLLLIFMIFIGGFTRLSALNTDILSNSSIAPSLILELVGFPLLALWISRCFK